MITIQRVNWQHFFLNNQEIKNINQNYCIIFFPLWHANKFSSKKKTHVYTHFHILHLTGDRRQLIFLKQQPHIFCDFMILLTLVRRKCNSFKISPHKKNDTNYILFKSSLNCTKYSNRANTVTVTQIVQYLPNDTMLSIFMKQQLKSLFSFFSIKNILGFSYKKMYTWV